MGNFPVGKKKGEKRKKKCRKWVGLLPKQCHDTMEHCIVTWPCECALGWNCIATWVVGLLGKCIAIGKLYCNLGVQVGKGLGRNIPLYRDWERGLVGCVTIQILYHN